MKQEYRPVRAPDKWAESRRLREKKSAVMLFLLVGAIVCALCMPHVNVMYQNASFTSLNLLFRREIVFDVVALGSGGRALLTNPLWAMPAMILCLLGTMICVIMDRGGNTRLRRMRILLGFLAMVCEILSFVLLKVDVERIELKMGIGVLVTCLFLLGYLIYAICRDRTPIFEVNIYLILTLFGIVMIYPYINTLALSFDASGESVSILPKQFTWDNFKFVLLNRKFKNGVYITVSRTVIGASLALLCTLIFSYGLSKPQLVGRKLYTKLCVFTMYFNGGLIPTFIVFGKLGLTNNYLVYIIPNLINVFNMILAINYFKGISPALEESAKIDGAGDFRILFSIMIPVSAPIVAVIGLFNAVSQWNSWYDAYIYMIDRPDLKPLQNVLIDIVNESQLDRFLADLPISVKSELTASPVGQSIVAAAIILTIGPIILLYPLLQKYFIKGMMLGAVKE